MSDFQINSFDDIIGNKLAKDKIIEWGNKMDTVLVVSGEYGTGKKSCIELLIKKFNLDPTWIKGGSVRNTEAIEDIRSSFFASNRVIIIHDTDNLKGISAPVLSAAANVPLILLGHKKIPKLSKKKFISVNFVKIPERDIRTFIEKKYNGRISKEEIKTLIKNNTDMRNIILVLSNGFNCNSRKNFFINNDTILKKIFSENLTLEETVLSINEHPMYIRLLIQENYIDQGLDINKISKLADTFVFLDTTVLVQEDPIIEFLINKDFEGSSKIFRSPMINTLQSRVRKTKANNVSSCGFLEKIIRLSLQEP